jgi:hypothetical protein
MCDSGIDVTTACDISKPGPCERRGFDISAISCRGYIWSQTCAVGRRYVEKFDSSNEWYAQEGTALARIIERVKSKSRKPKAMRVYGPLVDVRNTSICSPAPSERAYSEL